MRKEAEALWNSDPEHRWWGARSNSDSDSWAYLLTQVQISEAQAPHPTARRKRNAAKIFKGTTLTWSHLFLLSVKATTGSLSWRWRWSTRVSQIPFSCWGPTRSFTPFPPCCCFPFDSRSFFASIACAQGGEWRLSAFGTGRAALKLLRFWSSWAVRQWSGSIGALVSSDSSLFIPTNPMKSTVLFSYKIANLRSSRLIFKHQTPRLHLALCTSAVLQENQCYPDLWY